MQAMTTHIRRAIALVAILTTILAAMPLAGMAQDPVDDQKARCKDGGWQTLTRSDGTPFANQGECVKYIVSEGGAFGETHTDPEGPPVDPPATDPVIAVTLHANYEWGCHWSFELSGFPAGQELVVYADEEGVVFDPDWGHYTEQITVVTGGDGTYSFPLDTNATFLEEGTSYVFTVTQSESIVAQTTVLCDYGR